MKSSLYHLFFCALILGTSVAFADTCSGPLDEFSNSAGNITNKRMVSYDDLKTFHDAFEKLQIMTEDMPCYQNTLEATKPIRLELRDKRIQTVNKYIGLKIYEEAGTDLVLELGILTGKKTNSKYTYDDLFSFQSSKKNSPAKTKDNYEAAVKASRENKTKFNQDNKCSDKINQNEAVNLDNARNQDGVGWCYAYTAADLLSFRLKKKISAVSLYNSGQSIEDDISDLQGKGGDIGETIENYLKKKNGLCLEEDLPSSDFKFCAYKNYSNFLNALYQSVKEKKISDNQCLKVNLNSAFPGVDFGAVNEYTNRYGTKNLAEYLFDLQCKKRSFTGYKVKPITQISPYVNKDALVKNIDTLLNKGEIVGLSYNYNIMDENDERVGGHASLVVGRRLNQETGDCEYLVRNSWGKDCTQHEGSGLTCHKNCDSSGQNCRYSGHFWVNQRRLKNAMMGIIYLP
jgi:hypothetical protein